MRVLVRSAHIARGENTRNTGARGPFFNDDIAFVQRQHAFEQFGRWLVTDGDESAVGCHMGFFASDSVDQINADQPLGITAADETFHRLVPEHLAIGMGEKPFLKDRTSTRLNSSQYCDSRMTSSARKQKK